MGQQANAGHLRLRGGNGATTTTGDPVLHAGLDDVKEQLASIATKLEEKEKDEEAFSAKFGDIEKSLKDTQDELKRIESHMHRLDDMQPRESANGKLYHPMAMFSPRYYALKQARPALVEAGRFMMDIVNWKKNRYDGVPKFGTDPEVFAQVIGTPADGGYLVPRPDAPGVVELIEAYGLARRLLRVIEMPGNTLRIRTLATRPLVYHPNESAAPSSQSKATFDGPELEAVRFMAYNRLSREVEEDSVPAIAELLMDIFALAFAKGEDNEAFASTASAGSPPAAFSGLLNLSGVSQKVMGSGDNAFTDLTFDYLLDLMDTVSPFALENSSFIMSTSVALYLRKLKDSVDGRYLWKEVAEENPRTIWGRPYFTSEVMPTMADTAASTSFILLGDYNFHAMGVRNDFRTDVHDGPGFESGELSMLFWERAAYKLLIGDAIGRLKTAS